MIDAIRNYCRENGWRLFGTPSRHDGEWRALVSMEAGGPLMLVAFREAAA